MATFRAHDIQIVRRLCSLFSQFNRFTFPEIRIVQQVHEIPALGTLAVQLNGPCGGCWFRHIFVVLKVTARLRAGRPAFCVTSQGRFSSQGLLRGAGAGLSSGETSGSGAGVVSSAGALYSATGSDAGSSLAAGASAGSTV